MNNNIEVYELGLMDYEKVLKIQTELFNKIIDQKLKNRREKTKNKTNNYLLFVEHPNGGDQVVQASSLSIVVRNNFISLDGKC